MVVQSLKLSVRIVLPLSAPGLVTTGLLAFIQASNEFSFALTFMQTPEKYTVPVAIAMFTGKTFYEVPAAWGQLMGGFWSLLLTPLEVILVLILSKTRSFRG